ncbi:MAG: F0F1 ATP synthase subunit A [Chloroflexi bacterium]|nr:F0F1 ATP synthase subunit A [Chloroflexota bacterium]
MSSTTPTNGRVRAEEDLEAATIAGLDAPPAPAPKASRRSLYLAILAVLVIDVLAIIFMAPANFPDPKTGINANLEFIPPHVLVDLAPSGEHAVTSGLTVTAHPSITSTIFTMWIVMVILVILAFVATRGLKMIPGRVQNFVEYVYSGLEGFAMELGGPPARRYVSLFLTLFLFIILANWSGLVPFVGKVEFLRAPTSDVNITFGLALVSFFTFHVEGVRVLGFRGYFGKFFNFRGFRRSPFDGFIDLFVGLLEFVLEFFKPVTLALRLFANIYGGELVLSVMTVLLISVLPLPFLGLELFVGFMQALVFAILTLTFTLIAIEGHHDEAHDGHAVEDEPRERAYPPLHVPEGAHG